MESTVKFHQNNKDMSELHNTREPNFITNENKKRMHIKPDPDTGHTHEVWKHQTMEEAYEDIFGDAIEEYNARQKRADRKITVQDYMEQVANDTRGRKQKGNPSNRTGKKLSYEYIIGAGNTNPARDDYKKPIYTADGHMVMPQKLPLVVVKTACRAYFDSFEQRNPTLKIRSCHWHADEGYYNRNDVWEWSADHMHMDVIPVATDYKQGLSVQSSIGKAFAQLGYKDKRIGDKWICAYEQFNNAEMAYFEDLVQQAYADYCKQNPQYAAEHGSLDIVHPYEGRQADNIDTEEYIDIKENINTQAENNAEMAQKLKKQKSDVDAQENAVQAAQDDLIQREAQYQANLQTLVTGQQELREKQEKDEKDFQAREDKLESQQRVIDEDRKQLDIRQQEQDDREQRQNERDEQLHAEVSVKKGILGFFDALKQYKSLNEQIEVLQRRSDRQMIYDSDLQAASQARSDAERLRDAAAAELTAAQRERQAAQAEKEKYERLKQQEEKTIQQEVEKRVPDAARKMYNFDASVMRDFINDNPKRAINYDKYHAHRVEQRKNSIQQMSQDIFQMQDDKQYD